MTDFVELRRVLATVFKWSWLLLLLTAGAAAAAYVLSGRQPQVFQATSTIMVGEFTQSTVVSRTDLQTSEVLAQTYADMALRQPVLQGAVEALGLGQGWRALRRDVDVQPVAGTQLLEITAESGSMDEAAAIADEVARQLILLSPSGTQSQDERATRAFVNARLDDLRAKMESAQARLDGLEGTLFRSSDPQQIAELQPAITTLEQLLSGWESNYIQLLGYLKGESPTNSLTIVEPAQANPRPVRPRTYLNTILGGAVGFLLAVLVAFLLQLRDTTLKSAGDVDVLLGVPVLGTINRIGGRDARRKLLLFQEPGSPAAEAYRVIRSSIEFKSAGEPLKAIVVTSSSPSEGKSVTAANLAIIMAQAGLSTVLVDADLRHPTQGHLFQLPEWRGLAEAIRSPELDLGELLLDTREVNLRVLGAGAIPQNPAELIRSDGMRRVLDQLRSMADVVICDTPPALGLTDAGILSNRADGTVLVIDAGQTHLDAARRAVATLQQADANLIGAIVNRGRIDHTTYYGYGYGSRAAAPVLGGQSRIGHGA